MDTSEDPPHPQIKRHLIKIFKNHTVFGTRLVNKYCVACLVDLSESLVELRIVGLGLVEVASSCFVCGSKL